MKKYAFLIILVLGVIPDSFSQDFNKKVRYGIRAGLNYSNLNFSDVSTAPENPLETTWKPGFVGGFYMVVPLAGSFLIQPEYLYSQTGGKAESSNLYYSLSYLSLPVFLRWEAIERFSIIAGPQFDLLIDARQKNKENPKITSETESRSVGVTGGIEWDINNNFGIGVRYFETMHELWIPITDAQRLEFKHQLFQASLFYNFQ